MARPLIDFVRADGLAPRELVLAGAERTCRAQELSCDAASGERSLVLDLPPGWSRAGRGVLEHDEELFVLAGELEDNDDRLCRYAYVFHPRGSPRPLLRTERGARVLAFLHPDAGDGRSIEYHHERAVGPLHLSRLDWERPRTPSFPAGAARKTLRIDPLDESGLWVLGLLPHWKSGFTEWHTAEEENFLLEGEIETTAGVMTPGAYLAHPPEMVHGPMRSRPGALVITRVAGGGFSTTYAPVQDYVFPLEL
jgi:Domain of unknown function (DUF4437)